MTTLDTALNNGRCNLQLFKFLTKIKVSSRLFSRHIYTTYTQYRIAINSDNVVVIHDGCEKKELDIQTANICLENDSTTMSLLMHRLIKDHFACHRINDDKFTLEFYIASMQKLDKYQYSFWARDILNKETAAFRKR